MNLCFFLTISVLPLPAQSQDWELRHLIEGNKPILWQNLTATGEIVVSDQQKIPTTDWIRLKKNNVPSVRNGPYLTFENGDQFTGNLTESDGRFLQLQYSNEQESLKIPLSRVSVIWFQNNKRDQLSPQVQSLLSGSRKQDYLVLRNGDIVPGTFSGKTKEADQLRFNRMDKEITVSIKNCLALLLNTELSSVRKIKELSFRLHANDGSTLTIVSPKVQGKQLEAMTLFKQPVRFSIADLIQIDNLQSQAVSLVDLKPVRYQSKPYLKEERLWTRNESVLGHPLQLLEKTGIRAFERGISQPVTSEIVFTLEGKYRALEARVGIDPRSKLSGDLLIRWEFIGNAKSGASKALSLVEPWDVKWDISGAKELRLIVEGSSLEPSNAAVNWIDPLLIP